MERFEEMMVEVGELNEKDDGYTYETENHTYIQLQTARSHVDHHPSFMGECMYPPKTKRRENKKR